MNLVADSHIMIWYVGQPDKLSSDARRALNEAENTDGIGVSAASLMDLWFAAQKKGPSSVELEQFEELKSMLADPMVNAHLLSVGLTVFCRWKLFQRMN